LTLAFGGGQRFLPLGGPGSGVNLRFSGGGIGSVGTSGDASCWRLLVDWEGGSSISATEGVLVRDAASAASSSAARPLPLVDADFLRLLDSPALVLATSAGSVDDSRWRLWVDGGAGSSVSATEGVLVRDATCTEASSSMAGLVPLWRSVDADDVLWCISESGEELQPGIQPGIHQHQS
jgi:hypothetical protein